MRQVQAHDAVVRVQQRRVHLGGRQNGRSSPAMLQLLTKSTDLAKALKTTPGVERAVPCTANATASTGTTFQPYKGA